MPIFIMNKVYKKLVFALFFFASYGLIADIFQFIIYFLDKEPIASILGITKIVALCTFTFLSGYYYARLFDEKITIKSAALLVLIAHAFRFLFFLLQPLYLNSQELLVATIKLNLIIFPIYLWVFVMIALTLLLNQGSLFYLKKDLNFMNALVFGICMFVLFLAADGLFMGFEFYYGKKINIVLAIFSKIICIPFFSGFYYAKIFKTNLSASQSIRIARVYIAIIGFLVIIDKSLQTLYDIPIFNTEILALTSIIVLLLIGPFSLFHGFIMRWGSKMYVYYNGMLPGDKDLICS